MDSLSWEKQNVSRGRSGMFTQREEICHGPRYNGHSNETILMYKQRRCDVPRETSIMFLRTCRTENQWTRFLSWKHSNGFFYFTERRFRETLFLAFIYLAFAYSASLFLSYRSSFGFICEANFAEIENAPEQTLLSFRIGNFSPSHRFSICFDFVYNWVYNWELLYA